MPAWHPEIQDLVKQMLTVDSSKRITIKGIKEHRAFRRMMPIEYVLPEPLPEYDLNTPIDPEEMTEEVQAALAKIGITSEELIESLNSPDNNLVKLFIIRLTRHIQMDELPWDRAISVLPESEVDLGVDVESIRSVDHSGLPKHLKRAESQPYLPSSPPGSIPEKADWLLFDPEDYDFDSQREYGPIEMGVCQLMSLFQTVLVRCGFRFLHPNDYEILAKNNENKFLRIIAMSQSQETISWSLQMKGEIEDIPNWCERIRSLSANSLLINDF
jgi:serine/threonine protein kinase